MRPVVCPHGHVVWSGATRLVINAGTTAATERTNKVYLPMKDLTMAGYQYRPKPIKAGHRVVIAVTRTSYVMQLSSQSRETRNDFMVALILS